MDKKYDANAVAEVEKILEAHNVKDSDDLFGRDRQEIDEIDDSMSKIQEKYGISEDDINEILTDIFLDN